MLLLEYSSVVPSHENGNLYTKVKGRKALEPKIKND